MRQKQKKATAIITPSTLDNLRQDLLNRGVQGMTVTEIKGCGPQRDLAEPYLDAGYTVDFLPKIKIAVAVDTNVVDRVIEITA